MSQRELASIMIIIIIIIITTALRDRRITTYALIKIPLEINLDRGGGRLVTR